MRLKPSLDALFERAVAAHDVPGVAAMLTDGRELHYEGAFGLRTLGEPAAMSTDTVGWIASMTKAITSVAALQCVEQGRLDLDAPAFRVLPEIARLQVLEGFDEAGKPRMRAPKRPITLRHLLSHSAGLGYDAWNPEVHRYQQATGLPSMQTGRTAAMHTPLLFDPGERWNYGIGIDWAGRMIEQVGGKRLGQILHEQIFEPIGMDSTAFRLTPAMRERLAKMHQRGEDGSVSPLSMEIEQNPEFEGGGGGLYSCAADYLKFLAMLLNDGMAQGHRVLRPETVAMLALNQIGPSRVQVMRSRLPARSEDAEFFPGLPKAWGLIGQTNLQAAPTGRAAGSLMWAGLSNCYWWLDRTSGLAGVFIAQLLPFADRRALPLYLAFETEVYRQLRG